MRGGQYHWNLIFLQELSNQVSSCGGYHHYALHTKFLCKVNGLNNFLWIVSMQRE